MSEEEVKREMVNLLRSGATMLADQCPTCGGILFRLRSGEVVCPGCKLSKEARVGTVAETKMQEIEGGLTSLEETLMSKLFLMSSRISETQDISKVKELVQICGEIISVIERLRSLRRK